MTAVLKATGVSVSFGGVHAVVDVDLEVGAGTARRADRPERRRQDDLHRRDHGLRPRASGRVELDGHDLTRLPPHARARRGLARTWQSIELFDDLTVRENLLVASHRPSLWQTVRETVSGARRPARPRSAPALELLGLSAVADELPSELSQGQRKLVGIARALVAKPASSASTSRPPGSTRTRARSSAGGCARLADDGQAMLLVDHDMGLVLGICDEIVVLEFGKVIARGPADVVRRDPQVIAAYLGSAASELAPSCSTPPARTEARRGDG